MNDPFAYLDEEERDEFHILQRNYGADALDLFNSYKICKNCRYFHALGGTSYACKLVIEGQFMLSACRTSGFSHFHGFDKTEEEEVNLFTELFLPPKPTEPHRMEISENSVFRFFGNDYIRNDEEYLPTSQRLDTS